MTAPERLVLTDDAGDTLEAYATPAGNLGVIVDEAGEPSMVALDRARARELLRYVAAWLGEPAALAVQPDVFHVPTTDGTTQRTLHIANRSVGPCPVCGHQIYAGAFVVPVIDPRLPGQPWAHDECAASSPAAFPPAVSKTAITGDAAVTEVEGRAQ